MLSSKIEEIQANVQVGSCVVAADKTDDLIADVQQLPSSVNSDVKTALLNGANQLKILLADPNQCQGRTTTSETTTSTPVDHGSDHHHQDAAHDDRPHDPDPADHDHEHPDAPGTTIGGGTRAGSGPEDYEPAQPQGRADLRPLPDRGPPRLGRDVDRLPRHRHDPRAHRGGEDPRRAPLRRRALRRPLPPRGAGGREAGAPQHRPGLRHRQRRRPVLHRHGVRPRPLGRPAAAVRGQARPGDRGRDRRPGLRRPRLRPPPRDHPPRRQAGEPDDHRRARPAAAT